jgi:hypothetical protein
MHNVAIGLDGNLTQVVTGAVGMPIGSAGSGLSSPLSPSMAARELHPVGIASGVFSTPSREPAPLSACSR